MTRTIGSRGSNTLQVVRRVGLELIFEHGYEAMTLRMLADGVGIKPGSLYNHFRNKQELLFDLVRDHLTDIIARIDGELASVGPIPERFDTFVIFHVTAHMERKREVYVANSELRALTGENLATILELRSAYEARLTNILQAGIATGELRVRDVRLTTFAILSMLTGVSSWFKPRGRLKKDEIVREHVAMARRLVGSDGVESL